MFYCEKCKKRLENEEDWFMVKDELWKEICKKLEISEKSILCTECFEKTLEREIETKDLRVKDCREAPINFWIIKKYKDKSRISFIRNQLDWVMSKKEVDPQKVDRFRRKCKILIKFLQWQE